ncbi:MAG: histidine phosphatase family protein [Chlamydiales bacterium]|nr:histidine phosphatase family protein [Chlamydiales bacterium]
MIQMIFLRLLCACSGHLFLSSEEIRIESIQNMTQLPVSTSEMTRMYFIPNGESEYSIQDENGTVFTSGKSPNVPLTERGLEQAFQLKAALSSKIRDVVIHTAPAKRAEQTALQLLSAESQIAIGETYEGLIEVGMGIWEGKSKDQLYKNEYQTWKNLSAADKYMTPKVFMGESFYEASARALLDLKTILSKDQGKTIFIISGENLLNALAMRWSGSQFSEEPGSQLPMLPMEKCDLFMIEIPHGQPIEKATLKLVVHKS